MRKIYWLPLAFLLAVQGLFAQPAEENRLDPVTRTAGVYYSYEVPDEPGTPAPEGYEPFYISHYGRHGSRWHTSASMYQGMQALLQQAHQAGVLTPLGKSFFERVNVIAPDALDRYGDLSPKGVREHRGIAERMFYSFPQVFSTQNGKECNIECRASTYPRCILSMAANNERLKELNPAINITRESSKRYMYYLCGEEEMSRVSRETKPMLDSIKKSVVKPERLITSLFNDSAFVSRRIADPVQFMVDVYMMASIMQDTDCLGISLYDLLTPEELYALWDFYNYRMYINNGPSAAWSARVYKDVKPLLQNIVESADEAIRNGKVSATLRFGHDVIITPLAALMQLDDFGNQALTRENVSARWQNFILSPMAANLQLVFYKNEKEDVLVKVLYNERERHLPLQGGQYPYYSWKEARDYFITLLNH